MLELSPLVDIESNNSAKSDAKRRRRVSATKPIVGIDGEGITRDDGSHDYIMLASSSCESLRNPDDTPLSSRQILWWLWRNLSATDLNVIFAGNYDFNMWLKGLGKERLQELRTRAKKRKGIMVHGFYVTWQERRSFSIKRAGKTVIIYDVFAFFQCSFIKACDTILGTYEGRDFLVAQKAARGVFDVANADEISRYNNLEVDLLVLLVETLRDYLIAADMVPKRWYGPGAIVNELFRRMGVEKHKCETPAPVQWAARVAYTGGRFEMFKYGDVDTPVWEYDINSAYPDAIRKVPSLTQGDWIHHDNLLGTFPVFEPFTVYYVRYYSGNDTLPNPIFHRNKKGSVCYPEWTQGWIWGPEYEALLRFAESKPFPMFIEVVEAWEFVSWPGADKPFSFIDDMYDMRREAKKRKDGIQIAYKLALNSVYGKTAQQVGWGLDEETGNVILPKWFQLEWAGFITSSCRAKILDAITANPSAIIAVETDAVFSTEPLNLPVSDELGDWEETYFSDFTYVQSGVYFATEGDGVTTKTRGIERGELTREEARALLSKPQRVREIAVPLTRFVGSGTALGWRFDKWCRWEPEIKRLKLYPTGKRVHVACPTCEGDYLGKGWHLTQVGRAGGESQPYKLAWMRPTPAILKPQADTDQERMLETSWLSTLLPSKPSRPVRGTPPRTPTLSL